jgi:hypothetical protein
MLDVSIDMPPYRRAHYRKIANILTERAILNLNSRLSPVEIFNDYNRIRSQYRTESFWEILAPFDSGGGPVCPEDPTFH